MTSNRRRHGALLAAVLSLAVLMSSCSDDDAAPEPEETAESATPEPAPMTSTVKIGKVVGKLPAPVKVKARDGVAAAVDAWIDAAYIEGEWPRTDFSNAFPGFTQGATREARKDIALLTNKRIGDRIDSVRATKRDIKVDLLATNRKATGATARFEVRMRTTGEVERVVATRGRLLLTPSQGTWQIFGFDVSKGNAR